MIIENYASDMIEQLMRQSAMIGLTVGGRPAAFEDFSALQTAHADVPEHETIFSRSAVLQGLEITVRCRVFRDSAGKGEALEVSSFLKNTACRPSAAVSDIQFLHTVIPDSPNAVGAFRKRSIMYAKGSHADIEDFRPCICEYLDHDKDKFPFRLDTEEDRSSSKWMPYMNYRQYETEGVFLAVGWSGKWDATFYPVDSGLDVTFHYDAEFSLLPGEEIALPTALLLPWSTETSDENVAESFNLFRRFVKRRILPRIDGKPVEGQVCLRAWGRLSPEEHRIRWENMKKYRLRCDAYGVDAGWYPAPDGVQEPGWYNTVGDWVEDPKIYPEETGIGALADGGREAGAAGFWLWFEFERAVKKSRSYQEHPEFYLSDPELETDNLINLADPAAKAYIREKLCGMFEKTKLTVFRIDFNFDTGRLFAANERPGNRGLLELQYYNGLYQLFAELLDEFPHLIIDNCASGGRRQDYRMQQYSIPIMCRSDYMCVPNFAPEGQQAQIMASARYLPVSGDSCGSCLGTTHINLDTYRVRSAFGSGIGLAAPKEPLSDEEGQWFREMLREAYLVRPYMSMDFYPLTGYSTSTLDWCAWECCSEEKQNGLVMAFRREHCGSDRQVFELHGVDREAMYEVRSIEGEFLGTYSGSQLRGGYEIRLAQKRSSCIHLYQKIS